LLYPLLVAALRLLFGRWTIYSVQLVDSCFVIVAACLTSRAFSQDIRVVRLLWIAAATSTMALYIGYCGMETSLLLLDIAVLIYGLRFPTKKTAFWMAMFLLPLIRPDAIAFGVIFAVAMWLFSPRSSLLGLLSMASGAVTLLAANFLVGGEAITATMRAKEIAYHPSHSPAAILHQAANIFLYANCFLIPVSMRPWIGKGPELVLGFALFFALAILLARRQRTALVLLGSILAAVILVPAAYALGGVFFPWYAYPSNWLAQFVVALVVVQFVFSSPRRWLRRTAAAAFSIVWLGLFLSQLVHSVRGGTEEFHYRGDVGRFLAQISGGKGTLFLEPAGYIGFYSGLRTQDEVGLVSPGIFDYMRRYPNDWWFEYVQQQRPDYLVQRESFDNFVTYQGYHLTPLQQVWFQQHYVLLRHFHYQPAIYYRSKLLKTLLRDPVFSTEYLVYESKRDR
jgi:hypothetical protein